MSEKIEEAGDYNVFFRKTLKIRLLFKKIILDFKGPGR